MRRGWFFVAGVLGLLACGENETDLQRPLPPPDVFEDQIPGRIFTRGPGGAVITGDYADPQEVFLYGIGIPDGNYVFEVVAPECERVLASPRPPAVTVPSTADRSIVVQGGNFGPIPVAPFLANEPPDLAYWVYVAPLERLLPTEEGCFGFPLTESFSANFTLAATETTSPQP